MNKEDLIRLIDSLKLPKEEYYILSGGSLVLYGLRGIANDLDICMTPGLFMTLENKYHMYNKNTYGFYQLNYFVQVTVAEKSEFKMMIQDGYQVETLESILAFKKTRTEPKHIADVEQIEAYLKRTI